jgi:hypothetical protein
MLTVRAMRKVIVFDDSAQFVHPSIAGREDRNMARSSASTWTRLLLLGGACAAVYWLERRRPLRRETEPKSRRDTRNLAVAALSAATIQALEKPIVGWLSTSSRTAGAF